MIVNIKRNKTSKKSDLLPVECREINIGNEPLLKFNPNLQYFLVGDRPIGISMPETEEIPKGVDKVEYNNTLANAYLFGII